MPSVSKRRHFANRSRFQEKIIAQMLTDRLIYSKSQDDFYRKYENKEQNEPAREEETLLFHTIIEIIDDINDNLIKTEQSLNRTLANLEEKH